MKKSVELVGIACVISSVAVLISAVNMLICAMNDMPLGYSIAIFCCMIAVFSTNLGNYLVQKKKVMTTQDEQFTY